MADIFYGIDSDRLIFRLKNIEVIPNLIFIAVSCIYLFYFADIPFNYYGTIWTARFALMTILILAVFQLLIAPATTYLFLTETKKLNKKDLNNTITPRERTMFIKKLMSRPLQFALHNSYSGLAAIILHFFITVFYFHCDMLLSIFLSASLFFTLSITAVVVYIFTENVCSKKVNALVKKALDKDIINTDRFYGLNMYLRIFFHIIMPFMFSTLILIFFIWKQMGKATAKNILEFQVVRIAVFNFIICFLLSFFFYRHIFISNGNCIRALEKLTGSLRTSTVSFPLDLGYELEYNIFQTKEIISLCQKLACETNEASRNILDYTSKLVSLSNDNAETTSIEYEKVKDNLEYITNIKNSSKNITEKIKNVHNHAENTQALVYEAIVLLQEEIKKMSAITNANLMTITGIKNLNTKIEDVWEVLKKIEALAEKDKMIAFNAELKINAAEEEGENFHIIAYSLRSLVSTIKSSTKEITESLKSIQESADNLIITSEGGTQKIRGGSNFYTGLEEHFKTMLTSSDVTLESVTSIQEILNRQYAAFLQINTSLLQMAAGFDQFANNSLLIKNSSENLINNANELYQTNSMSGAIK